MKIEQIVQVQEVNSIEIPDEMFPMFFVKDKWSGVPKYWKITNEYIEVITEHDVYAGKKVEYARYDLLTTQSGNVFTCGDDFDYLLTDFLEIWEEDQQDPNQPRRITAEEYADAKSWYMGAFL